LSEKLRASPTADSRWILLKIMVKTPIDDVMVNAASEPFEECTDTVRRSYICFSTSRSTIWKLWDWREPQGVADSLTRMFLVVSQWPETAKPNERKVNAFLAHSHDVLPDLAVYDLHRVYRYGITLKYNDVLI
jgi:hypothetical protein